MKAYGEAARPRNAAATKEAMLQSARRRFVEQSYDNVGLRDIARDVGVDVALVSRYFGSKEELFQAVLRAGKPDEPRLDMAAEDLPQHLADRLTSGCSDGSADVERLLIILRSASSHKAAEIVRAALRRDALEPMARLLEGPNAQLRASMAIGVMVGAMVMRSIMAVEPPCGGDRSAINRKLTRMLQVALDGDGFPEDPAAA